VCATAKKCDADDEVEIIDDDDDEDEEEVGDESIVGAAQESI
jgi:hypothetical protein